MNDDNNGDGNMLSPTSLNMHQQGSNNRYNNRDDRNNSGIPGLGIDIYKTKAPNTKPIPKEFEKAWKSSKPIMQSSNGNKNTSSLSSLFNIQPTPTVSLSISQSSSSSSCSSNNKRSNSMSSMSLFIVFKC